MSTLPRPVPMQQDVGFHASITCGKNALGNLSLLFLAIWRKSMNVMNPTPMNQVLQLCYAAAS